MSATCPACGVAVVPGYVKCPRCGGPLPSIRFKGRGGDAAGGGTAVGGSKRFPWLALVLAVVVAGGIIGFFDLLQRPPRNHELIEPGSAAAPPVPIAPATADSPEIAPASITATEADTTSPKPDDVAASLDRSLKHQHIWSTVRAVGGELQIRSGSCADPGMAPAIEQMAPSAHAAGLSKVRCVEQSGVTAFAHDL